MIVNANSAVETSTAERSSNRRTVIKGAAWTVPVIAAAIAAPAASASGDPEVPVFNDWSVGGSASVGSGNNGFFTVSGQSIDGERANLPAGFNFVITPPADVVLGVIAITGFIDVVVNADGSVTGLVIPDFPGTPRITFKVTGPVGSVIPMVAYGPFEPFEDSKFLTITR